MTDSYPSTESILSEMNSEKPAEEPKADAQQPLSPSWTEDEYEHNGKTIREPRDMILKRASQGYNYAQQMHALNQQAEKYKGYDERLTKLQRWQEYNDYAEKNPAWAKHVEESWHSKENLQQSEQIPQQQFQLPPELQQTLSELKAFRDETLTARQQEKFQAEDKQFAGEIEETGTKYGVDLSQADEQGRSLEWRVLEHMKSMGIDGSKPGHFRAAFKDYYFDNLLDRQKESVKENEAKSLEERRKAGILDISRTPKTSKAFNPVNHSYSELAEMAKQDLIAARKG